MTVLVTTHYMEEAEQPCDRVALMHRGRIRAARHPAELIAELGRRRRRLEDVFRAYAGDDRDEDAEGAPRCPPAAAPPRRLG